MIGQTISHYNILEKLGEGGMGVVYKAEDTKLDRLVALKFLPKQFSINEDEKKRFIHEAKAAASLDHPNICAVYEIGETEDGQMFIAMAYYDGETLKDKIKKGPLKLDEALDIAIQVAEGLNKAHKKDIVHRDIKAANIMMTNDGVAKIVDFGLAKLKGQTKLTKEGTTLGTVAYMSPEQTTGEETDHRSDIWSLGVLLYEMVTGQLPFKGEYEQAIMYAIMNEEQEPVTGLRTGVSMDLEKIINKALVKDPSDRYQHVDDMMVDLRKLKKDSKPEVSISRKKTSPEITLKGSRKVLILGSIFIATIIIAGYFIFKGKSESKMPVIEPGEKPSIAIVYFENNTGDEKLDYWRSALAELMITDLSQSKLINVLPGDRLFGILKKLNLLESKKFSTEDLLKVAAHGKTNHIIRGNYIKIGENFRINIMIYKADSGDLINSLTVECREEKNVFSKVDEVTKKIKLNFDLSEQEITKDIDRDIGTITTSSLEAYKNYITAGKLYQNGNWRKAIPYYKRAIAIDPRFATAYRSLAMASYNIGDFNAMKRYVKKSFELSDRISDRERYRNQAEFYLNVENNDKKAMAAYKKLLEFYPEDLSGHHQLGLLYSDLEEWDNAVDEYKISLKDEGVVSYFALAEAYEAKGLYDRAEELLSFYLNNISDNAFIRRRLAHIYILQNKYDLAIAEADKASSINPDSFYDFRLKGDIYTYKGELIKSEQEYQKLLESGGPPNKLGGRLMLSSLFLLSGKFNESINQVRLGLELAERSGQWAWHSFFTRSLIYEYIKSGNTGEAFKECKIEWDRAVEEKNLGKQTSILYFKGVALADNRSLNLAQKTAVELRELVKKGMNQKRIRRYFHLMGIIESKRNNSSQAVEYFEKAMALLPHQHKMYAVDQHALFIEPLAAAFYKKGDFEKAQEQYEKIISLTTGRLIFGDIYAKAIYMLGKIYEHRGFKGKAIDNYIKFIELWKNCDPQFQPLVEDARKRVTELERSAPV
jgi:serine/threonine protein kinase/Tfp pilus assembly protein PilF